MSKRLGSKSCAALIVMTAGACLAGPAIADQTHFGFNLAGGANSAAVTVPITDHPVLTSCTQTLSGNVGQGLASVIRSSTAGLIEWMGFDYASPAITRGFSSTSGTHMIWCDLGGSVDIQVLNATQIRVHNALSEAQSVDIMFNY